VLPQAHVALVRDQRGDVFTSHSSVNPGFERQVGSRAARARN
jgi:hypothetical protein